jgi:hypothetical protein
LFVLSADTTRIKPELAGPKLSDQPQDFAEQIPWHRDLGHLEDDLGADLDELVPLARQRPVPANDDSAVAALTIKRWGC